MRPEQLAQELRISGRTLRGWLRETFPRPATDHGAPWVLTEGQVAAARERFGGMPSPRTVTPAAVSRVAPAPPVELSGDRLERRRASAERFRPNHVKLLLVAEAPPGDESRYFYFGAVTEHDSLFRYVVKGVLGVLPARAGKDELLAQLQDRGVYLIDLSETPDTSEPEGKVPGLIDRCRRLAPDAIILIKTGIYDVAHTSLVAAGLPVINARIPFPGSGHQREFEAVFAVALRDSGFH